MHFAWKWLYILYCLDLWTRCCLKCWAQRTEELSLTSCGLQKNKTWLCVVYLASELIPWSIAAFGSLIGCSRYLTMGWCVRSQAWSMRSAGLSKPSSSLVMSHVHKGQRSSTYCGSEDSHRERLGERDRERERQSKRKSAVPLFLQ